MGNGATLSEVTSLTSTGRLKTKDGKNSHSLYLADTCNLKGAGNKPIPRITTKKENRVNRLKAIGNGQVPQVAAAAWQILTGGAFL